MDTIVVIFKDGKVLNHLNFQHVPSSEEIAQFVELHGGTSGRKLEETEIVLGDEVIERPKPFASWVWNSELKNYDAPTTKPEDGNLYTWNEEILAWEMEA